MARPASDSDSAEPMCRHDHQSTNEAAWAPAPWLFSRRLWPQRHKNANESAPKPLGTALVGPLVTSAAHLRRCAGVCWTDV